MPTDPGSGSPPTEAGSGPLLTAIEEARVRAPLAEAWTLPPRLYTDPEVWELEVERIFRRDWIGVARAEQLAEPGSQLAVEVADQPIVLTCDDEGTIRALANVCLHRAMPLVRGRASGAHLRCPYHLWSYALDGRLRSAPLMAGCADFDPGRWRLPSIPVEVWQGFVFVSLAPDPEPLGPALEPLGRLLAGYRFDRLVTADVVEFDSPWNWKLLVENFMEAYHHIGPHRRSLQPNHPAAHSSVADNRGGPWALLDMPGDPDRQRSDDLPFLSGLDREQRGDLVAACVFPTLLVAGSGTLGLWYQLVPTAHDHMDLRIHLLLEPETLAIPAVRDAVPVITEAVRTVHLEDVAVNEGPWRGLHAPLTDQGRLAPLEKAIWQLNQLWLDRVAETDRVGPVRSGRG